MLTVLQSMYAFFYCFYQSVLPFILSSFYTKMTGLNNSFIELNLNSNAAPNYKHEFGTYRSPLPY